MLSCKDTSVLLSHAQDRPLGLRERILLKLHLLVCDGCTNFSRQLVLMRTAMRRLRDGD
jgi:hypothetical protein